MNMLDRHWFFDIVKNKKFVFLTDYDYVNFLFITLTNFERIEHLNSKVGTFLHLFLVKKNFIPYLFFMRFVIIK